VLTSDEFASIIRSEFGLERVPALSDLFEEDLGFDSADMLEVILVIEEQCGPVEPSVERPFPIVQRVGDAYELYAEILSRRNT
jgi:hypothetical protein